jgi:hypothetical protein
MNRFDAIGQMMSDPLGMLKLLSVTMITGMLEDIAANLTRKLAIIMKTSGDVIDDDYRNRFAIALYFSAVNFKFELFAETGGIFNWTWNLLKQRPDMCSLDVMLKNFRDEFNELSPTMAAAVTPEIIQKTALLILNDWVNNGEPDETTLHQDTHFYFDEMIELEGTLDSDKVRREGADIILAMSDEELANFDPEMIDSVRQWAAENPKAE